MRYSLLSRFRGCLLGAAIGDLGADGEKQSQQQGSWGKMAVITAQSLIRCGRFDVKDLHSSLPLRPQPQRGPLAPSPSLPLRPQPQREPRAPCLGVIIATLPVILFYHDNKIKLRQNLLTLVNFWQDDPVSRDGALAVGYATLMSLTEKLNRAALIPQTIDFIGESPSELAQQLAQVQTLLEQGAGLEKAVAQLGQDAQPSTPIALAFYCFLSTLEDLRLSILRAARTRYHLQNTSAITGALSGTYNSTAGIPTTARMALSRPNTKMAAWGMKTEAEMLHLSDSLLGVWSGVYDQATHPDSLMPVAAIAAPRVIR